MVSNFSVGYGFESNGICKHPLIGRLNGYTFSFGRRSVPGQGQQPWLCLGVHVVRFMQGTQFARRSVSRTGVGTYLNQMGLAVRLPRQEIHFEATWCAHVGHGAATTFEFDQYCGFQCMADHAATGGVSLRPALVLPGIRLSSASREIHAQGGSAGRPRS